MGSGGGGAHPQNVRVISYTSPAAAQEQSHDRGVFESEGVEKTRFFKNIFGSGGEDGDGDEAGRKDCRDRGFQLLHPNGPHGDLCTVSLPIHPHSKTHTGVRMYPRWQTPAPRTLPKQPFLPQRGQKEQPDGERRQHPIRALPSSQGLGSVRLHNRWERGDTALLAQLVRCPPTCLKSTLGTPPTADRGVPMPIPRLPLAGHLAGPARSAQTAPGSADKSRISGPEAVGEPRRTQGPFPPGLPGPRAHVLL